MNHASTRARWWLFYLQIPIGRNEEAEAQSQAGCIEYNAFVVVSLQFDKGDKIKMKKFVRVLVSLLASLNAGAVWAQGPKYPPLSEYMMPPDAGTALARSAAPANISDRATIKVLTKSGYQV